MPSWSRLKFAFIRPVLGPLAIIAAFGTLVRVKELIPKQMSFFLHPNEVMRVFWPASAWSSVDLAYLASLLFVAGYGLFKVFLPRDIEVSSSQNDYLSRSVDRLTELNVAAWFEKVCSQIECSEIVVSKRDSTIAYRYRDHLVALRGQCEVQSLDDEVLNVAKALLQSRYDYLNRASRLWVRTTIFALLLFSTTIALVVALDGVGRSLLSLPWTGEGGAVLDGAAEISVY